jgi:hypothetical protein
LVCQTRLLLQKIGEASEKDKQLLIGYKIKTNKQWEQVNNPDILCHSENGRNPLKYVPDIKVGWTMILSFSNEILFTIFVILK